MRSARLLALAVAGLLALASEAWANYIIKDGNGVTQTVKSIPCAGGVICTQSTPADQNGNPLGVPGNPLTANGPVSSTLSQSSVSCGTSATMLLPADTTKIFRGVVNVGAATIYWGSSGVTTSTGTPLIAGQGWDFSHFQGALYCVVGSGTVSASVVTY